MDDRGGELAFGAEDEFVLEEVEGGGRFGDGEDVALRDDIRGVCGHVGWRLWGL